MKNIITLLLLVGFHTAFAQPKEGAIRTKDGMLLYFNLGANSHTLDLIGDVNLDNFPFIKAGNTFLTGDKSDFGSDSKSILNNYMNWEKEYIEKQLNSKVMSSSEHLLRNGLTANFWKFTHPAVKDQEVHTPVKATYFLDLVQNDLVYRLSYPSVKGDDAEAKGILFRISDNLRFYETDIDLEKLRDNIIQGRNYY